MKRIVGSLAVAMAVCAASAATSLFDFESEDEIKAAPRGKGKTFSYGVTNLCATSGRNAFFLSADRWRPGDYAWPAFTLSPSVHDMSGYDRLVIDVMNLGADGDVLALRLAGPDGKTDLGLSRSLALPAWGHSRWVVDLQYWPKEASPTNITRVYFYTHCPQDTHVFLDRFVLLKPGEPLPPPSRRPSIRRRLPWCARGARRTGAKSQGGVRRFLIRWRPRTPQSGRSPTGSSTTRLRISIRWTA